jgi:hypothetical protein
MRRPWTPEAQSMIEARVPDADIARQTGVAIKTVQDHRRALGYKAFNQRQGWSRRDWLMHDAAGLDFQR